MHAPAGLFCVNLRSFDTLRHRLRMTQGICGKSRHKNREKRTKTLGRLPSRNLRQSARSAGKECIMCRRGIDLKMPPWTLSLSKGRRGEYTCTLYNLRESGRMMNREMTNTGVRGSASTCGNMNKDKRTKSKDCSFTGHDCMRRPVFSASICDPSIPFGTGSG